MLALWAASGYPWLPWAMTMPVVIANYVGRTSLNVGHQCQLKATSLRRFRQVPTIP